MRRMLLENFGEKAREFAEWLRQPGRPRAGPRSSTGSDFADRKCGNTLFTTRSITVSERIRVEVEAAQEAEPLSAVLQGDR